MDAPSLASLTDAFLTHHRALGHSPCTIQHYADSLRLLARFLTAHEIPVDATSLTTVTMNGFAAWLRDTPTKGWRGDTDRSLAGIHGALKDVKAFVRWLEAEELIAKAPKVPVPRRPQTLFPVLSEEELARIFASRECAPTTELGLRSRALIAFMLDTGVRLAEVANLTLDHLDLTDGTAQILGKGGKERLVYISPPTTEVLRAWLAIRGDGPGTVFWLSRDGIRMVFRRIRLDTGLPVLHPHQLRHTAFTMLVRQNVDLHTIKRIAGHASVTTTEAYLALSGTDLQAKHTAASPFARIQERLDPHPDGRRRLRR